MMNDWEYVVEGGQHVLFRRCASKGNQLVRVSKDALFLRQRRRRQEDDDPVAVRRQGLHTLLTPYIDLPACVDVYCNEEQLHQLVQRTVQSGKIPSHRIHDWIHGESERQVGDAFLPCSLVRDYRQAPSYSNKTHTDCWSIEIKPKAGYTAITPLVALHRTYKFQQSRCCLMANSSHSDGDYYDPVSLFSGSHLRIVHALQCLVAAATSTTTATHPRPRSSNLLSVWRNGAKQEQSTNNNDEDSSSWWIPCVAAILKHEPFLQRVHALQQLDIIDADGALVLYHHVLDKWGGDDGDGDEDPVDRLEALLDSAIELESQPANRQPALHPLLDSCPIPLPSAPEDRAGLLELCRLIASFHADHNLTCTSSTSTMQRAHATARHQALALVADGQLTVPACCFLLQTWLLSLSMCDVSFFVTLWPAVADDDAADTATCRSDDDVSRRSGRQRKLAANTDNNNTPSTTAPIVVFHHHEKLQSPTSPGRILLQVQRAPREEAAVCWEYEIKLIDFDPKPARKLRTRHAKEQLLDTSTRGYNCGGGSRVTRTEDTSSD